MSDSAHGTVVQDRPPDSDNRPAVEPALSSRTSDGLVIGERWHDFLIEEIWPAGGARAFLADQGGRKVVIRAMLVGEATEWRRGAWERLSAQSDLQTVHCISAEETGGWRYEVSTVPPAMNLLEWLACHRPGFAEIEALVRQLAATLGALHAQGVVHLNICPSVIYIDESVGEPVYILGGLHEATLYTQPVLMPSDVDPFYAPPEAAGVARHQPGTRLCAWDWWSTGRAVQEFLIGRHILGLVLDRDVTKRTPELRARAEALLLEREPAGVRAGALEYMQVEPALAPLLRGLLTGSLEARWGLDAVQRWLRHEPVQDHYELPRNARLWVFRGRSFTLAEAADYFTRAENWDEGEEMLFDAARPETLAVFLKDSPAHRAELERLQSVCDLSETAAWGDVPVVARRTVTAALAWLSLANGSGVRTPLRVRGQSVDVAGLTEVLRVAGASTGVAVLTAMLAPAVIGFVESFDAAAARVLTSVATKGLEALRHGEQHGWLDPHDAVGHARMLELALKAGALLRERIDLLRSVYATNSNPALATILAAKVPSARDTVILAFTAEAPERYGYITHDASRRQRFTALQSQADALVSALFWFRLQTLLARTVIWGLPSTFYSGGVLALTAIAMWLSRSAAPAATIASVLLISRVYFCSRIRTMTRKFDPSAPEWMWSDGSERVAKQVNDARLRSKSTPAELGRELAKLQVAMLELSKSAKQNPAIVRPEWWDLWLIFCAAVLLTFGVFVSILESLPAREPKPTAARVESNVVKPVAVKTQAPVATPEPLVETKPGGIDVPALLATGRYELVDDGFGRQLRGPLKPWTFYATGAVEPMEILARAPATPEQSAYALVSGTLLLEPYPRKSVSVLLAVRVPTTRGFGVIVFNSRDRKLVDHEVLLMREPLQEHTWYQLEGRRIGYLGSPANLGSEISLAPP
ncbi:MAG: serine/threonine-protein kinase [Opitutus sp.]